MWNKMLALWVPWASLPVTQATRHPGTSGMPEILLVPRGIVFTAIY